MAINSPMDPKTPRMKNVVDGRSAHDSAVNRILKTIIQRERFARRGFQRETNLNLGKAW
jgi:hypothetical protein